MKYKVNQANHASMWFSAELSKNSVLVKINCSTSKNDFLGAYWELNFEAVLHEKPKHIFTECLMKKKKEGRGSKMKLYAAVFCL